MLTVVAPDTFQLSVEDSPAEMLGGLASKEFMTGSWPLAGRHPGIQPAASSKHNRQQKQRN
ncbi:MAG: hypothetical protein NTW48_05695 [Chloroflexi bacterium]|nr:hypothetical protein [Chloroflexota bacterium]